MNYGHARYLLNVLVILRMCAVKDIKVFFVRLVNMDIQNNWTFLVGNVQANFQLYFGILSY